jgi:hypothetical protein
MPQSDFAWLAIQHALAEDILHGNDEAAENGVSESQKSKEYNKTLSKTPVSVTFISDALATIKSTSTSTSPVDHMDIDEILAPIMTDMFEPIRTIKEFAPPKRFYRRIWSSLSRRILTLSNEARN